MRRQAPVLRDRRPSVVQDSDLPAPHRHHRLDRQHHAGPQLRTTARIAEVRDLRLLVQGPPDPVTDEGADHREPVRLDVRLDRVRHVGESPPGPALLDGPVQALAGHVEELLDPRRYRADRQRERAVRIVPLDDTTEVQPDDVTLADLAPRRRDPVHDLFVDRDARRRREPAIALERGRRARAVDERLDVLVDLERRHPRANERAKPLHHPGQDVAGPPHERDLARRLEHDHRAAPTTARIASRISSIEPSPDTVVNTFR